MTTLLTLGPVPAKLDSVKYITNRFKGGLGLKLANKLSYLGNDIVVAKWRYADIDTGHLKTITFDDIIDYKSKVLNFNASGYILSAAVANLMPVKAWEGKFPSHKYSVGEEFDVKFCIAPRVIDEVKRLHPRAALVGYKLFDGPKDDLISAARKTLEESKANLVFANTPKNAAIEKYMLTQDGIILNVSFENHIFYIDKLINCKYYKTIIDKDVHYDQSDELDIITNTYPRTNLNGKIYGTFMIKLGNKFVTTSRGKTGNGLAAIQKISYTRREVVANNKATLNSPLMYRLLERHPDFNIVIHNHEFLDGAPYVDYEFPGTNLESNIPNYRPYTEFNIRHHGYIKMFKSINDYTGFINGKYKLEAV